MKSDQLGRASNYGIRETTALMEFCYCCGKPMSTITQVVQNGVPLGAMVFALCSFCEGAHFKKVDGYWQICCPFHDIPDVAGMVYYWDSIDKYNELTGEKKRGKRVSYGVDWKAETGKLRELYKKGETK